MMAKLFLPFVAVLLAAAANAQTTANIKSVQGVRPIEFEMHVGATRPLGSIYGSKKNFGPALGMELRYNFRDSPFDAGFAIDITTAVHYGEGWVPDEWAQSNRTAVIGFMGDYNFRQGDKVNPFVGMGWGLALHDALIDVIDETNDRNTTAMIIPRVGVELWRHLRLTLAANLSCKYFNNMSLTVGFVIGGGKKKQ